MLSGSRYCYFQATATWINETKASSQFTHPRAGVFWVHGICLFVLWVCFVGLFCFFKLHPLYKQNQRLRNWSRIHTTGLRPVTWKPASNRLISVPPCKIYFPYFETKKGFYYRFLLDPLILLPFNC